MRFRHAMTLGVGILASADLWQSSTFADTAVSYESSLKSVGAEPTTYGGANAALGTGLVLFTGPYLASVAVAAESSYSGDQNLYIPLVGPWIDYAGRPSCPQVPASCAAYRVLVIGDGIAQDVGALAILASLLVPRRYTNWAPWTWTTGKAGPARVGRPTVHFIPASYPGGGGVAAVGTF